VWNLAKAVFADDEFNLPSQILKPQKPYPVKSLTSPECKQQSQGLLEILEKDDA
jgi:hypothetical protein